MWVARLKFKPAFAEEGICWKDARELPDIELGEAGAGTALGGSDPPPTGLPSLPMTAYLCLLALFLRSSFLGRRSQGHQQPLAPIFLLCTERVKGLILLVPRWKIPENDSGSVWITGPPPGLIPVAGSGVRYRGWAAVFSRTISVARDMEHNKNMPGPTFTQVGPGG